MTRKSTKQSTALRELALPEEAAMLYPLVRQINPGLRKPAFLRLLKDMLPLGYRCLGAFDGKKLVGACGIWTASRFWCGPFMEMDNLVVDQDYRNKGVGKRLTDWVEKDARKRGCAIVMADSYSHNTASHRFYFRENYIIKGFCFVKELY